MLQHAQRAAAQQRELKEENTRERSGESPNESHRWGREYLREQRAVGFGCD
jgi:hypothetical protein